MFENIILKPVTYSLQKALQDFVLIFLLNLDGTVISSSPSYRPMLVCMISLSINYAMVLKTPGVFGSLFARKLVSYGLSAGSSSSSRKLLSSSFVGSTIVSRHRTPRMTAKDPLMTQVCLHPNHWIK